MNFKLFNTEERKNLVLNLWFGKFTNHFENKLIRRDTKKAYEVALRTRDRRIAITASQLILDNLRELNEQSSISRKLIGMKRLTDNLISTKRI